MRGILRRRGNVEPILVLALAIIVLAVIGFAAYLYYSERINFFKFLPDFDVGKEKAESIEIVGYNIKEGSAEYYDGTSWIVVPVEGVRLGDKRVLRESLLADFGGGYWYGKREGETRISLPIGFGKDVRDLYKGENFYNSLPYLDANILLMVQEFSEPFDYRKRGDIIIILVTKGDVSDNRNYGEFSFDADNKLRFRGVEEIGGIPSGDYEAVSDLHIEIKRAIEEKVILWRDSALEKPINIRYVDADGGAVNDKWFCVEFIAEGLVVRLNEEVARDAKCLA